MQILWWLLWVGCGDEQETWGLWLRQHPIGRLDLDGEGSGEWKLGDGTSGHWVGERQNVGPMEWRKGDPGVLQDPALVLSIPVNWEGNPRRARTVRWRTSVSVGSFLPLQLQTGEEIVVSHPLPAEVPRLLREQIDAIVVDTKGDCQQRSREFAASWPGSRVVAGLVVVKDRLVPHAWVEIPLNDGWIPIDPTLGGTIADAARLRLGTDGPERLTQLVALANQGVTVVEQR